ncbi:hypothetical protein [Nitratifractor sp.]|nr:hypothetical protein [Nitratifractor sp.]
MKPGGKYQHRETSAVVEVRAVQGDEIHFKRPGSAIIYGMAV